MLRYTDISLQNFQFIQFFTIFINIIKYFPISLNLQKYEQQFHGIFSIIFFCQRAEKLLFETFYLRVPLNHLLCNTWFPNWF